MLAGALSPIYAVGLVTVFGFTWMPVAAMIPVLIFAAVTYYYIPDIQDKSLFKPSTESFFSNFRNVFGQIYRIWIVAFSRAVSGQGLRFFLPLVISSRGGQLTEIGTVLFVITIGASVSPVICGKIADIFGAKRTLVVILFSIPFLLVPASLTEGIPSILLFMVGYALLTATEPITNAMAQQSAPNSRGMASSIIMGFAFGLGGVVTAPLGAVADHFGLTATMLIIAVIPSLSIPVILSRKWK
jgi:FSR family fosmidomycin resistance protein-like MFS transporter